MHEVITDTRTYSNIQSDAIMHDTTYLNVNNSLYTA